MKELTLDLKLGYYDFEKNKPQKVKFSLEIDYEDKKPTNDKIIITNEIVEDFIKFVGEDSLEYNDYGEYFLRVMPIYLLHPDLIY